MKKTYQRPGMNLKTVELQALVALSDGEIETGGEGTWDANARRGKWGDLWADGEE